MQQLHSGHICSPSTSYPAAPLWKVFSVGTKNGIEEPLNSRKRFWVLCNQINATNAELRFADVRKGESLHLASLARLQRCLSQGLEYCG